MPFRKPITEIIRQRFSCRTYLKRTVPEETQAQVETYLARIDPGPFGSQPRFKLVAAVEEDAKELKGLKTYGFIKNPTGFILGATPETGKNLEDFGYLMEQIILFATDLDLGTCWLGGTFTRSRFAKNIALKGDEIIPAVASVGWIAKKPRSLDQPIRDTANADRRLPWEKLFFDGDFSTPMNPDAAGAYATPLEMVRLGPSASNKQPWRIVKTGSIWHFFLCRTPGYRKMFIGKLLRLADLQRVDMGIAMCHFERTASELALGGEWALLETNIKTPDEMTEYVVSWGEGV